MSEPKAPMGFGARVAQIVGFVWLLTALPVVMVSIGRDLGLRWIWPGVLVAFLASIPLGIGFLRQRDPGQRLHRYFGPGLLTLIAIICSGCVTVLTSYLSGRIFIGPDINVMSDGGTKK